ncbi:oligosaccharide flippase family protein [Sulfurimonas sp. HSL3-2]|uniref:lipopolysaccharide biosynthesis protein n=1 Tax=Hydrocurvibacter mobilis TaxID=3131936 RepID=UPI0031F8785A
MKDSLKRRYAIKLLANIIVGIINAVIIALVPKALGPIAYGQFVYLQEFFMKIIGFLDMGSSIAFFTKLSAKHTRKELITFYFIYSFLVLCLVFSFIFIVDSTGYLNSLLPDISNTYVYMGLFFGFFTWLTQIFIKISDAYAFTVSVELIKIGHKLVTLLLLIYFIYMTIFDLKKYFVFHYIALGSFIFILIWFFIKNDLFNKSILSLNFGFKKVSKEFLDYCHPLFINTVITMCVGLFDIWLLQTIAGSKQMGFYGLAYSLAAMCFLFTSAMTPIITREFSKSYEQKDLEQMKRLFYRYIPMLYSIAAYFSVFISIESENVLSIFTDEKYKGAFLVLVIMAFYPIHQTYGQLSGSIFYATGQTKLLRNIALVVQPIGMLLTFVFVYTLDLGAVGLAYKMIIVQFIGIIVQLYFNSKFLKLDIKYFLWHQVYSVVFFILIAFISSKIISLTSPLYEFLISGFIYTLLVTIGAYIFPQVFATNREELRLNFSRLKNVIKK